MNLEKIVKSLELFGLASNDVQRIKNIIEDNPIRYAGKLNNLKIMLKGILGANSELIGWEKYNAKCEAIAHHIISFIT